MTLILRDDDVRRLARFPDAVAIVSEAIVSARAGVPAAQAKRSFLELPGGWLRVVTGTLPAKDIVGFKAFHLTPGGVRYLCSLYRLSTGEPLALLDANYLTVARTSAAAASAARHYWGDQQIDVAVIGSGTLATDGLRALVSVCRVDAVRVFSPTPASRRRFAQEMQASLGVAVSAVESAAQATASADMVLCATQTSGRIALTHQDAGSPRYISSVSSTLPTQRELDAPILRRAARVVVDTTDALVESGDLIAAGPLGADAHPQVVELAQFLMAPARVDDGLTVYKSIGSAEQDLSLAAAVLERAVRDGVGETTAPIEHARGAGSSRPWNWRENPTPKP